MCHALSMLILYLEVSSKKNPNNFCAFDAILFMCVFQGMLDEMAIPRYFVVSTDSRICPSKMQLYLKGVLDRVTDYRVTFTSRAFI